MQKQQEQPRQRNLDGFMQWSRKVIEESRKQKGDCKDEKKEIKKTSLWSGHSELGGLPNLAGQV